MPSNCLHELFSAKARELPNRIAVSMGPEQITYRELDQRSDHLAGEVMKRDIVPDDLVGLYIDRSIDLVVGILAILKAGGAYVPLDPAHPNSRTEELIKATKVKVVVTVRPLVSRIEAHKVSCVCADERFSSMRLGSAYSTAVDEKNLAYVIYTSGSTGHPKGVMVEHRNVSRLFRQTEQWFKFSSRDVWTMFHSVSFDFSVWELWGALLYGGRLVIVAAPETRSPFQFHELLIREKVTILCQTPSAFRQLAIYDNSMERAGKFSLRTIVFGGEALDVACLGPWIERYGDDSPTLVNMYGITETTVHVTYRPIKKLDLKRSDLSPIGVPIPDLTLHLVDDEGQRVPNGEPGELLIAGAGLARGYLADPKLTSERFVDSSFDDVYKERCYKSGDKAIRLADGELIYLGRKDDQVKVRGYRIEPKEVEMCLRRHPQVCTAAVVSQVFGAGDVRLVAHIIPHSLSALGQPGESMPDMRSVLAAWTASQLPPHMCPSVFHIVEKLPLTVNGKLDRDALAQQKKYEFHSDAQDQGLSETERLVIDVWKDVLQRGTVGREEDFFDLGGTSIAVLRMLVLVEERVGARLDPGVLADGGTVARLALAIDSGVLSRGEGTVTIAETEKICQRG